MIVGYDWWLGLLVMMLLIRGCYINSLYQLLLLSVITIGQYLCLVLVIVGGCYYWLRLVIIEYRLLLIDIVIHVGYNLVIIIGYFVFFSS